MEYHCVSGIFFLLSIHLISVNIENAWALDDCYWSGTGPICDGKCRIGEMSEPDKNEKIGCMTGKKKYCCKAGSDGPLTTVTELTLLSTTAQGDKETNTSVLSPATKDDCYWVGKSPNCEGSCLEGDYMANTSRTGNGSTCIVGKKKYCCKRSATRLNNSMTSTSTPPNVSLATASLATASLATALKEKQTLAEITDSSHCHWVGEPPLCLGSCKFGEYVAARSPTGDGEKCESGQKKYCCSRTKVHDIAKKTVRESNKQSYNDVDPISNSTSRPVQSLLPPTHGDLPVNATGVKHHLIKRKRKLVRTTTTTTTTIQSTSIPTATTTELPTITPASTTSSTKTLIKAETFLPLPDVLPVPLMFRTRPPSKISTLQSTTAIPLSTLLASSTTDKQEQTIVLTTTAVPSQSTNTSTELLQIILPINR